MLAGTRCAEIIGQAADGQYQCVVLQTACGYQLVAFIVQSGGQLDGFRIAVQPGQAAQLKVEMVPLGLGQIVQFVIGGVQ
jgi:hypothetical protein